MRLILAVLLVMLGLFTARLQAQDGAHDAGPWTHRSWSADDGLPQNTATALAQTSDGYLWVGTYKGLARFDGLKFTTFETSNSPGLSGDRITQLLGDSRGNLWIGTEWNGLSRYRDGRFESLAAGSDSTHFQAAAVGRVKGEFIRMLYEDIGGHVWIGVRGGLYRFDGSQFQFVPLSDDGTIGPADMAEDRQGNLWLASDNGVGRVEGGAVRWPTDLPAFVRDPVSRLVTDHSGNVWALGSAGFGNFTRSHFAGGSDLGSGYALEFDRDGLLWMATRTRGLVYFDGTGLSDHGVPDALESSFLRDILITEDGIVWIAGGDLGLHRLQPRLFESFVPADDGPGVSVNRIADGGNGLIWAGSLTAGLWKIDEGRFDLVSPGEGLPGSNANLLVTESDGSVWVTANARILQRSNGRFVQPREIERIGRQTGGFGVVGIARRAQGGVWLATPARIFYYDNGRLSPGVEMPEIGRDIVFEMFDQSGTLWLAPRAGLLCRLNGSEPQCFGDARGIPRKNIRDVHENRDGSVWFGTYGAGLCQMSDSAVVCLSKEHGLPDNTAHKILEDDFGYVWISSNKGVSRIKRTDVEQFFAGKLPRVWADQYGASDGMPSAECNIGGLKDQDGVLWFPTMNGVTSVDPGRAFTYSVGEARTRIERVVIDGNTMVLEEPRAAPAGSDRIEFEFTGINFAAPERVRFRARLVGHDEEWVDFGDSRSAAYTNLPPGEYRFEVQSAIGSAGWGRPDARTIVIRPFFYQTVWFRILAGLLVLGTGIALYRTRVNRLIERERLHKSEAEARRLAELDAAKSRFFANISHEFRTPLTLIITPTEEALESEILEGEQRRWGESVLDNARRLLGLINRLLDLSRLEAGRLDLAPTDCELVDFVRAMVQQFVPAAERKSITLRFQSELEERPARFDADKLHSIVGNLVSNALKYTPVGGKVWVTLTEGDSGVVEFVVKDTGPGIPRNQIEQLFDRYVRGSDGRGDETIGSGIGLALVKELVDLHGGVMLVESEVGFGTAFIVRLALPPATGNTSQEGALSFLRGDVREDDSALGGSSKPHSAEWLGDQDKPLILVVEDNEDVRSLLSRQLAPSFRILTADNGQDGLREAILHEPDLILTDVMMPGLDGLELCRSIKGHHRLGDTPVVILTARATDEHTVEALKAGADDYIPKPYHAETLRQKVSHLIEVRQSLRDRYSGELVVPTTGQAIGSVDEQFAARIVETVSSRLHDATFSVEGLAGEIGLSRRQLTRRVKDVFGESPSDLLLRMRLERAADLLSARTGSISEIAYAVGFKSPSHFGKAFKEAYGHTPSQYIDLRT